MEIKIGGTMSTTIIVILSDTDIKTDEFLGTLNLWEVTEWLREKYKHFEFITDWYRTETGQFYLFDARRHPSK
jgi:hypothetical protein